MIVMFKTIEQIGYKKMFLPEKKIKEKKDQHAVK